MARVFDDTLAVEHRHRIRAALTPVMEAGSCPLCSSEQRTTTSLGDGSHDVVRCNDCGLHYLSPRMKQEAMDAARRRTGYLTGPEGDYREFGRREHSLRRGYRRVLETLAKQGAAGGRLLEIGSGLGYFLDEARPHFAECTGIEFSSDAAEAAAELSGATVHDSLEALPEDAQFDCIVALDTVDCIYDPVGLLRALGRRLAPDGVILVAVPDIAGTWRRMTGSRWSFFEFPERISYFDRTTLHRLFVDAGFAEPSRFRYGHYFPLADALFALHMPAPESAQKAVFSAPGTGVAFTARRTEAAP